MQAFYIHTDDKRYTVIAESLDMAVVHLMDEVKPINGIRLTEPATDMQIVGEVLKKDIEAE